MINMIVILLFPQLNDSFTSLYQAHSKVPRHRDEASVSIPWQRRDMSRKSEYEFLEFNPFCDLAEFSQRYKHVHQRTYYRWKRRIKEEYIILEQNPEMSFQEFSSMVVQAKEPVFSLWKSMISQGKGFYAPSDSSKRLEAKNIIPTKSPEYSAIQKNLSMSYEHFSQQYPGVSVDVFNSYKQNVMQEFWLLYQNQHMSYKEFSKLVSIGEDIFKSWKDYAEALRQTNNIHSTSNLNLSSSQVSSTATSTSTSASPSMQYDAQKGLFSLLGSSSAMKDSLPASTHPLNPAIADTVARSLSASYLASLQNMMLPWQSYYGMTPPLGQQMLPAMMMWPGMMGLSGGVNGHLGLPSTSSSTKMSTQGASLQAGGNMESKDRDLDLNMQDDHDMCSSKSSTEENGSSGFSEREHESIENKEDSDGSHSSWNRSRKQNKVEYVHYLKNPELGFKELESLIAH